VGTGTVLPLPFSPFYVTRPSFLRFVCRSNTFILYQIMTDRTVKYHSHVGT